MLLLRTALIALCCAIALAIAAPHASFAEPTKAEKKEAFRLFGESERRYREGRFEDAAHLLRRAYQLDPAPTLLFNLARALESAGELEGAVTEYRKYLQADPEAKDRRAIEKRLATLDQQLKERAELARIKDVKETPPEPPRLKQPANEPPLVKPPVAPARALHPAPIVLGGIGTAGLIIGGILGAVADGKRSDARRESSFQGAQMLDDDARSFATGANVSYVTGGALLTGGLIWLALELTE